MDRVFLDANILFSAAYLEGSGLSRLWAFKDAALLSSGYAIEEARRNLAIDRAEAVSRFKKLVETISVIDAPQDLSLPASVRLDPKDRPILLSAIYGQAGYLLTGDARHFGHLYGTRIEGVLVFRPKQYFELRGRS